MAKPLIEPDGISNGTPNEISNGGPLSLQNESNQSNNSNTNNQSNNESSSNKPLPSYANGGLNYSNQSIKSNISNASNQSNECNGNELNYLNKDNEFPVKLVVYDFDQTITSIHLYRELDGGQENELLKMSDDQLLTVFGGKERTERLNTHFERITSSAEIAIISFGWVGVIRTALKRIGLSQYFDNDVIVIGKDSQELKDVSGSKAECIQIMRKKRKLKSKQVIFVDDDNMNIQKAIGCCQTIRIKPRKGMTQNHMKTIEEKVGVFRNMQMEVSSPHTVQNEASTIYKYPSNDINDTNTKFKKNGKNENEINNLTKYIPNAPQWFDNLVSNDDNEPAVVVIGGDQTPSIGDDGDFELVVPISDILPKKLEELADQNNE